MKVAQELAASPIPRQIGFAEASQHSHVGLQQGKEALRSVLMHLTAGLCLLRVVDLRVEGARERSIAAGRVGPEAAAPLHSDVGGLWHRFDSKVPRRWDDDTSLAADPPSRRISQRASSSALACSPLRMPGDWARGRRGAGWRPYAVR